MMRQALQTRESHGSPEFARLEATFRKWNSWTIDVPGNYYLEVIEKLYKRNELATEQLPCAGAKDRSLAPAAADLSSGRRADEVVAPEQLLAVGRLVGTAADHLRHESPPAITLVCSWASGRLKNIGRGSCAG